MPKKLDRPATRTGVRIFDDDLELLRITYMGLGYNQVIRSIVSKHCRKLRALTEQKLTEKLTREELDLG